MVGRAEQFSHDLPSLVARRVDDLTAYQNAAYAARYRALAERVAAAERALAPDSRVLATAVARGYFKLLAYKDEYEVARLHTDPAFRAQLEAQFAGDFRVELHLAPPFLSRPDPATGRPRKRTFGPWLLPWLRLLARCRRLRGTPFDPFGATAERRLERRLIREYEADLGALLDRLTSETLATAVELAQLPQQIRGYGFVKERHAREAATRRLALRERLGAGTGAT
jgi:indolepyruvate ferredoxin oxidoreductase